MMKYIDSCKEKRNMIKAVSRALSLDSFVSGVCSELQYWQCAPMFLITTKQKVAPWRKRLYAKLIDGEENISWDFWSRMQSFGRHWLVLYKIRGYQVYLWYGIATMTKCLRLVRSLYGFHLIFPLSFLLMYDILPVQCHGYVNFLVKDGEFNMYLNGRAI